MDKVLKNTVSSLSAEIRYGKVKSLSVVKTCLNHIKKNDSKLKAFLRLNEEKSLKQAEESDVRVKTDARCGLFEGVPIAIKDNIMVKGESMTSASKYLKDYVSPYDATVIEKLKEAGVVFIGRTNMDEFAMGSSTETSAYQKTVNPWNTSCIPGGSSGGSAVAVSAGMVPFALGSDTG
ncbi:MAG: hypothetical protein LBS78_02190, partial [Endomicrobium sp.]|nr:hypothetical protein [Endomicrobium sp.]